MSMIYNLRRVSDEQIAELLRQPGLLQSFLYGPDADKPAAAGFFGWLLKRDRRPSSPVPEWAPPDPDDVLDLDKAWHGIHFLLTGTAWEGEEPLCFLLKGGQEIGSVDVGYGPARSLTSSQLRQFSESLTTLSVDELPSHFNPERMALDIYPAIWDRNPADDDTFEYLTEYLEDLQSFVRVAAERGLGMVTYLN